MSERTKDWIIDGIINVCVFAIASGVYLGGALSMRSTYRQKAIEANVAEWVITDQKAGDVEFRWKTNQTLYNINLGKVVVGTPTNDVQEWMK